MISTISDLEKVRLEESMANTLALTAYSHFSDHVRQVPSGTAEIEVAPNCYYRTNYEYNPETMLLKIQGRRPLFLAPPIYHAARSLFISIPEDRYMCWE